LNQTKPNSNSHQTIRWPNSPPKQAVALEIDSTGYIRKYFCLVTIGNNSRTSVCVWKKL